MNGFAVKVYVTAVCSAGILLVYFMDWGGLALIAPRDFWGLGVLALLGLVAEQQALIIKVGRVVGGSSIAFLPLLMLVLLYGPAATVAAMVVSGSVVEYLVRRNPPLRANFNIGQYVASAGLAGLAFELAGGVPLMGLPEGDRSGALLDQFGPFILFGLVFLLVNNAAVAKVIALNQQLRFRDVWRDLVGRSGTNILSDLLIGPMAIAVAALYLQIGTIGLVLTILPLFFIRHSYLTTQQLQQANRDLLKALVKAIETRDPYTSGHSMRVAALARKIAEEMHFPMRRVDDVETAGLLHDIGKIEGVYAEILAKPAALSEEERRIIESHVTKGVELLQSLASYPKTILDGVRHHHERIDGSGYPDGLKAEGIPVIARILNVCDAIDAMLSDRPYRAALSVEQVHSELVKCAGKHFDVEVVTAVIQSNILEQHVDAVRLDGGRDVGDAGAVTRPETVPRWGERTGRRARASVTS